MAICLPNAMLLMLRKRGRSRKFSINPLFRVILRGADVEGLYFNLLAAASMSIILWTF